MTTALHPDEAAFLAVINREPDEDTHRLAYADWLEENAEAGKCDFKGGRNDLNDGGFVEFGPCKKGYGGYHVAVTSEHPSGGGMVGGTTWRDCPQCRGTGRVSDGREARAEFIRVQCELATLLAGVNERHHHNLDMILDPQDHERQLWKHQVWELQGREQALLKANEDSWAGEPLSLRVPKSTAPGRFGHHQIGREWSRGFVSSIACDTATFTQHAAGVFRAQPVVSVTLTDKRPNTNDTVNNRPFTGAVWYNGDASDSVANGDAEALPAELFDLLDAEEIVYGFVIGGNTVKTYSTASDAHAALSTACVALMRTAVGLPVLKGAIV